MNPVTATTNSAPASVAKPGGGERNRTDDLLLAKQALSQLSYTPVSEVSGQGSTFPDT